MGTQQQEFNKILEKKDLDPKLVKSIQKKKDILLNDKDIKK